MNDLVLQKAEKWFAELGIKTWARPTCLLVSQKGVAEFGTAEEILKELRQSINSKRLCWGVSGITDDEWLWLQTF